MSQTWPDLLGRLLEGQDLCAADTEWAMAELLAGQATPVEIAGFAVALRAKGETAAEITGLATAMLAAAAPLATPAGVTLVDTCGTGGDRAHTVNISTMAACVVAGALAGTGHAVAKHGNRAASSQCGSADVLAELGVAIDLPPAAVGRALATGAPVFCFAPVFHSALRHAAVTRKDLGVPTFFNVLGPLTNPARPGVQVLGVAQRRLAGVLAGVLAGRATRAFVVRGTDGLDEFTTTATNEVWAVEDGTVTEHLLDPAELGLAPPAPGALRGGDAAFNAAVVRLVLAGEPGAVRDAVLLNAGAALALTGPPGDADLAGRVRAGIARAAEAVDSGAAAAALQRWVTSSQAAHAAP